MALRVSEERGSMEVVGLEVLLGRYERVDSQKSEWVFKNTSTKSEEVFLYYWGGGEDTEGWWFGSEVGGSLVWCYSTGKGFPPPARGWRVPIDGDPEIEGLRVSVEESQHTTSQQASSSNGSSNNHAMPRSKRYQDWNGQQESNDSWDRSKRQKEVGSTDFRQLLVGKWHGVDGKKRNQWHEIKLEKDGRGLKCTSWTEGTQEDRVTRVHVTGNEVLWGQGKVKLDTASATGEKVVWLNPSGTNWHWFQGW